MEKDDTKKILNQDNLVRQDDFNLDSGKHADPSESTSAPKDPIKTHDHDGQNSKQILIRDLAGFFEIVSVAPTHVPKNMFEQIKLYVNGATYRTYFYDYKAKAWRFS